ncbi:MULTISPECIES: coenzyme F420-0:L-glutamate ligase [unclassified Solwaraspora]|uniref:coenzyme F420-0:L-glutamate ligase n=1 Tax=unclassified Solwaraspora TaxID=2627926 RepID=UPI00248C1151|nr:MULTISPECIES: coenzyme F420-0:L-glutamate ligase [unclassified Solwaraspora]WBB96185.1 coenzyme F420-0:L-glutamate ligase [Solwaraspora sp. WMMA2059]WBC19911.1 coenzyme F420-0:L-glutamate ligase [Solwaraspora sp. WMMA2080]WJK32496.1 coenzyme F420-0:L-glutamate ligase [Solwaraspora sp. WMMA2065]
MRLEILPVAGIGEVVPGDDLAALIGDAAPWLRDGDVLVVTSKIVSKAEGRLVDLPADEPDRSLVRDEVLAAETVEVVARRGATRIVRTRHGFVMAAAGIDNSNVAPTRLVLLPVDPDRSARQLRAGLYARLGLDLAVVVSDTMGRPWRNGLTDVALGAAGIDPVRDYRGQTDRYGNELRLTQMAVVDEMAAAGDLVKGKSEQVPVAVVRGYPWRAEPPAGPAGPAGPGVRPLIREPGQDLFTLGTAEARRAGLLAAATLPPGGPAGAPAAGVDDPRPVDGPSAVDGETVARAVRLVSEVVAPGTRFELADADSLRSAADGLPADAAYPALLRCRPPGDTPPDLVRFGTDLHRLRAALAADGVASAELGTVAGPDGTVVLLGLVATP